MEAYSSRLLVIINKVKILLDENIELKNELEQLNNANLALLKDADKKNNLIKELNEKNQMLTLAKSIGGEEEPLKKTELKRKLNEYIKEIDKCIALLNE